MENSSARPSSNGRNPEVFTAGENLVATAASPDDSGDTAAAIKVCVFSLRVWIVEGIHLRAVSTA